MGRLLGVGDSEMEAPIVGGLLPFGADPAASALMVAAIQKYDSNIEGWGRSVGRAIVAGVETPAAGDVFKGDAAMLNKPTEAMMIPFERGLRSEVEPFIAKTAAPLMFGLVGAGAIVGYFLGRRRK